jgi:hypothetical protein
MKMFARVALSLIMTLVLPALVFASGMSAAAPSVDYATTRASEKGLYTVSFVSRTDPIPLNKIHSWQIHVVDARGTPVSDATILVDGGMPQHGHGLPTKPRVTENLGNGDFLVEGLRFQMPGWWVVNFSITAGPGTDKVVFNLKL